MREWRRWGLSVLAALFISLLVCSPPAARAVKRAPGSKPVKAHSAKGGRSKKLSSQAAEKAPAEAASCPVEPQPEAPAARAAAASIKGDLTVNVRLKDGSLFPLPVNSSAGMLGFRQQLLSAGLMGHAAEPLRLQRFQDGKRISVPLNSTSELRGGDLIIIESSLSSQVPSTTRRWRPAEADFVPYPELQWKGGKSLGGRGVRRTRTFGDINLYKVTRQDKASVSLLRLDSLSMQSFIDRLTDPTAEPSNTTRVALLYGRVNATSGVVLADALFEPPQHHRPSQLPYDDAALESSEAHRAAKVAAMMGLVPVGWVVGNGGAKGQLTAQDVLVGAKLQLEAMKREGRDVGGCFVVVVVNAHQPPPPAAKGKGGKKAAAAAGDVTVEAYQVSKQAVQMVSDGLLDTSADRARLKKDRAPVTSEVFINGDGTTEVDTAFFTVPVGIATHRGPLKLASGPLSSSQDLRALISDEGRIDARRLPALLSDFHVLVLLNRYLKNEELEKVCRGLDGALGGKKKGKKGAKRAVPPAIAALVPLLEALCDEE